MTFTRSILHQFVSYEDVQQANASYEKARHDLWVKGVGLGVVLLVWMFFRLLGKRNVVPSRSAKAFYRLVATTLTLGLLGGGGYTIYLWKWGGGVPTQLLAGLVAAMGAIDYFSAMSKRAGQVLVDAATLRANDRRPPVLYLRGFEQEDMPASPTRKMFGVFDPTGVEGALLPTLEKLGPVIGLRNLAKPKIPTPYAVESIDGSNWQSVVDARIAEAKCIVMIVSDTPGLLWELEAVIRANALARCVWILPPATGKEHAACLVKLSDHLQFTPELTSAVVAIATGLGRTDVSSLALLFDSDGTPSAVTDFAGPGYTWIAEEIVKRFSKDVSAD